ncbi:Bidirectional sugar transporter SWEET [Melia azedarach]|uniref:Bidirectional sugar transporter SWEET n=1 Tax=Melia azedarach TaxID=155640 RepID=A0ACC1XM50_MELAZ|nr:Bidirectional sugar transporter SWEET [Melia azedarach]
MLDTGTIRTIVGIIGNVISLGLFLSPIPTMVKIAKQKSVGNFKPDPYTATVLNCAMWVFYGLPIVHPDSTLVITINGAGFVIELVYVTIFLIYSNWTKRRKIVIALILEAIFIAVMVFVTLFFFQTTKDRSMIVGLVCVVFNIIMYAAPLTVMKMVIQTKSVKYLPLPLALANLCNGAIWAIYALLRFDPYVLIPNGLGTISGLVQLILYGVFYKTTNWDDNDEEYNKGGKSEVQLTDV